MGEITSAEWTGQTLLSPSGAPTITNVARLPPSSRSETGNKTGLHAGGNPWYAAAGEMRTLTLFGRIVLRNIDGLSRYY
jgi:hypothetical protein